MIRTNDIKKEREELSALEVITRAFSEIASKHMLQSRNNVIDNREYLAGLSSLFDEVRESYSDEIKEIATNRNQKQGKNITFLSHNGKTVMVLFSANNGLFGSIIQDTFNLFEKEYTTMNNVEVTIIGELGKSFFESAFPNRPYTFFSLSDKNVTKEEITMLARHIVQYSEIRFFFGKFQNIVVQTPEMLPVKSNLETTTHGQKKTKYLFEPSLEAILVFFESELFGSILKQTIEESSLAKLGSRVFAMDEASSKISSERKKLLAEQLSISHREANKKQLNTLSSIISLI